MTVALRNDDHQSELCPGSRTLALPHAFLEPRYQIAPEETRLSECAHILDVTSGYAGIQVIGPHADHALSRLTDLDLGILPNLSCAQGMLAEIYALVVRCDVGHQTSYEIYVERSYGEYLWEVFIETGKLLDMIPVGIECIRELSPEGT